MITSLKKNISLITLFYVYIPFYEEKGMNIEEEKIYVKKLEFFNC